MKLFFKSFYLSLVIAVCFLFFCFGIGKTYENIRLIGFGEYKEAVEITSTSIRILDFEYELKTPRLNLGV